MNTKEETEKMNAEEELKKDEYRIETNTEYGRGNRKDEYENETEMRNTETEKMNKEEKQKR